MVTELVGRLTASKGTKLDHDLLTSLVNSMADGVIAIDDTLKIVLSNGAAQNILDINSSLRDRQLQDVMHLQDANGQPVDLSALITTLATGTSTRDLRMRYDDDSIINLYLSISPVRSGYGNSKQTGYVLLVRDITREKSLEEERDEFISVASHELRTPITIAEGNVSNAQFLADKSSATPEISKALQQAHTQIVFLADLINDLSTLSRAERGKLEVQVEDINVPELIKSLADDYSPRAAAKKLEFKSDPGSAKTLKSGKLYVREILQNFLTNALKYTEQGSVTLAAEATESGVIFRVSDTGIGVSKSDQDKLFDKFFRSEDFRTRKTNGTGLGLYVTQKLANLLHADINLESELNKGSEFSITIPNLQ